MLIISKVINNSFIHSTSLYCLYINVNVVVIAKVKRTMDLFKLEALL